MFNRNTTPLLASFIAVASAFSSVVTANTLTPDQDEYTLFTPNGTLDTFLIDKTGTTVHTWHSEHRPALSTYLLESGELLRTAAVPETPATFTGNAGGMLEILDWQSNVVWSATIASETYMSHHDAEQLPNGNILVLAWEAKTADEALALGRTSIEDETLWADAVYEICRASATNPCVDGEIVWRWSAWDHIVQNVDQSITYNYVDNIAAHPNKVDLNYFSGRGSSDWGHANAVDYNVEKDLIMISVHNFNEYWVLDHADASKGIVYRAGNPASQGRAGRQTLFGQHDVQWIEPGLPGAGNILLFNNGMNRPAGDFSTVEEICYEGNCRPGAVLSKYGEGVNGSFYSSHISGAQRLKNGNTLVCEGLEGRFFEYNENQ
ncbi:MAG: aryl-sulfate sulfotransferase, partial [Algicola sp.]|nr:aryl-sulfate sulfotransferase [Algicola sp.]